MIEITKKGMSSETICVICLTLLRDYEIDPTEWTQSEITNLVNLLYCYMSSRKYPIVTKGELLNAH